MLKKVNAIILGLAVLLAVGCGEEDNDKQSDPSPVNSGQKSCLLTKTDAIQNTQEFIYNSAGQVERINNRTYSHREIIYNTAGNVSEDKFFVNGNALPEFLSVYTYNADNLPETKTQISQNVSQGYVQYYYNAAKQLIKISSHGSPDTATTAYNSFSYPIPDQVITKEYNKDAGGVFQLDATTVTTYDDKRSAGISLGYTDQSNLISKHNITSVSRTQHRVGTIGTTTQNHSYTYNPEGYPVQLIITSSGQQPYTVNYEYNCQ